MSIIKSLKTKLCRRKSPSTMTTKIKIIPNPQYQKSGTKSYVHLMRKYGFNATKEGPYFLGSTLHQTGRQYTDKPIGGRAHVRQVLQKKTGVDDHVGEVGASDVQNDSMYLAEVGIGSPAQTLRLDFDTGSADLWVCSRGYSLFASIVTNEEQIGLVDQIAIGDLVPAQEPHRLQPSQVEHLPEQRRLDLEDLLWRRVLCLWHRWQRQRQHRRASH